MGNPERGREASEDVGSWQTRRAFLKRAGVGALLFGAGGVASSVLTQELRPKTPPRVVFPPAAPLRLHSVTIVDPLDGSKTPDMSIRIANGLIESIVPADQAPRETSEMIIDGAARFAVPGYNNMHVHTMQLDDPELAFASFLVEGVTGIRQMAGSLEMLRNRAEQRLPLDQHAPRLLQMPGALLLPYNAGTPQEARRQIALQWDEGADFIKLIQTEREVFFAAVSAAHRQGLRIAGHLPPSIKMSEAAISGFDCVEHLGTSSNLWIECSRNADQLWREKDKSIAMPAWIGPKAGEFIANHFTSWIIRHALNVGPKELDLLDRALDTYDDGRAQALGQLLMHKSTWQSPTLVGTRKKYRLDDPIYRTDPWLAAMSDADRKLHLEMVDEFRHRSKRYIEVYHRYYEASLHTVGLWKAAGVKFLSGTDESVRAPGQSLQLEFEELGKAGLSPLDILRSTTIDPASYLGRTDTMGRVAERMNADVLLLDADPLAAVENLRAVSLVVRGGHAFTTAELVARLTKLAGRPVPPVTLN
ncbi:amidohydrolase family protein [Solimonas terrae]|uniref:Amidohydrolase family protein n=1 Tax=Solimonas terrae TaxID=1396819 RepID=A0A6M2BUQ3_9GAMM|nr:amidohydrolase family protein [Solimonas terrae]NGY05931.1 amidohydrolase family protein [Solimonas terrae]